MRWIRRVTKVTSKKTGQITYRLHVPKEMAEGKGMIKGTFDFNQKNRTILLEVKSYKELNKK